MIVTSPRGQVIEKIIRQADGRLVRAQFFVYESQGRMKARLLEYVFIAENLALEGASFVLPAPKIEITIPAREIKLGEFIPSPYTESFLYFSSIKPRAPTV